MFQKFFTDTLISRFIKRLLRSTNIPLLHTIHQDSELIKGCLYLYDKYVIQCETSGKFYVNPEDYLTPGNNIYPSRFIFPAKVVDGQVQPSYIKATYKVIKYYDANDKDIHYNFHSRFTYYDPETHLHLGEYLRYLRDRKGLNLLPYYNCFNNRSITQAHLVSPSSSDSRTFEPKGNNNYKILAVPVKFGQTYTIAIDSDTPIQLRSLIYNNDSGCIIKDPFESTDVTYYSDDIDDYEFLSSSHFTKPFLKTIPKADSELLFSQENNLYLIIQVAKSNTSAITVLEGNYVDSWKYIEEPLKDKDFFKNLTLLHFNSRTSFAFSDRLIEYLLLSVINDTEVIDGNIAYVQELILKKYPKYELQLKGVWQDDMRKQLSSIDRNMLTEEFVRDLDGYLNKDLEKYLLDYNNKESY